MSLPPDLIPIDSEGDVCLTTDYLGQQWIMAKFDPCQKCDENDLIAFDQPNTVLDRWPRLCRSCAKGHRPSTQKACYACGVVRVRMSKFNDMPVCRACGTHLKSDITELQAGLADRIAAYSNLPPGSKRAVKRQRQMVLAGRIVRIASGEWMEPPATPLVG